MVKLSRQANWKLDPPLRKACKVDVLTYCASEDAANSEDGLVYKCMIKNFDSLSGGCQKEMGRAVHMAFFVWQPGAIITQECDDDINKLCLADRPNMASRPGAVGTCLATVVSSGSCNPYAVMAVHLLPMAAPVGKHPTEAHISF